jgi:hypothetical protein
VASGHSPTPIEAYRRTVELRQALDAVEAAIALRDERGSACSGGGNLEGLREDLVMALWLTEVLLLKR